jgi:NAD-dependent epimerase/dehydratase family protein
MDGGREKALAALCRKIAEAPDGGEIEIWGDGELTRSFLYIDECIEGTRRLMDSDFSGPFNIGSEEMVTINQLAGIITDSAGKRLSIKYISGPLGVRGRNSDNRMIQSALGWVPSRPFERGFGEYLRLGGRTGQGRTGGNAGQFIGWMTKTIHNRRRNDHTIKFQDRFSPALVGVCLLSRAIAPPGTEFP